MLRRQVVLGACASVALSARAEQAASAPEPSLRIGVIYRHMVAWTASRLLRHVFAEAGVGLQLVDLPSARSEISMASGEIDGEAARIPQYGRLHPELLRVDPPIYRVAVRAYSLSSRHLRIDHYEALKPLRVGYQTAVVYAMELAAGLPRTEIAQQPALLYRMLQANRVDAIIDAELNARRRMERYGVQLDESALLAQHDVHMYLRADKADQAPALSAAIRKLAASGQLASLTRQYEGAALKLPPEFD